MKQAHSAREARFSSSAPTIDATGRLLEQLVVPVQFRIPSRRIAAWRRRRCQVQRANADGSPSERQSWQAARNTWPRRMAAIVARLRSRLGTCGEARRAAGARSWQTRVVTSFRQVCSTTARSRNINPLAAVNRLRRRKATRAGASCARLTHAGMPQELEMVLLLSSTHARERSCFRVSADLCFRTLSLNICSPIAFEANLAKAHCRLLTGRFAAWWRSDGAHLGPASSVRAILGSRAALRSPKCLASIRQAEPSSGRACR